MAKTHSAASAASHAAAQPAAVVAVAETKKPDEAAEAVMEAEQDEAENEAPDGQHNVPVPNDATVLAVTTNAETQKVEAKVVAEPVAVAPAEKKMKVKFLREHRQYLPDGEGGGAMRTFKTHEVANVGLDLAQTLQRRSIAVVIG